MSVSVLQSYTRAIFQYVVTASTGSCRTALFVELVGPLLELLLASWLSNVLRDDRSLLECYLCSLLCRRVLTTYWCSLVVLCSGLGTATAGDVVVFVVQRVSGSGGVLGLLGNLISDVWAVVSVQFESS